MTAAVATTATTVYGQTIHELFTLWRDGLMRKRFPFRWTCAFTHDHRRCRLHQKPMHIQSETMKFDRIGIRCVALRLRGCQLTFCPINQNLILLCRLCTVSVVCCVRPESECDVCDWCHWGRTKKQNGRKNGWRNMQSDSKQKWKWKWKRTEMRTKMRRKG